MPILHTPKNNPNAPLVVVLPGMNSGSYLFTGAVAALGRAYRLHVFDTPGSTRQGQQVPISMPFSTKTYATEVLATLDNLYPNTPFYLIGHSLGSFAAQEVARMLHGQHTRLLGLVLVSSSLGQPYTSYDISHFTKATGHSFWQLMKMLEADPANGNKLLFGPRWAEQYPSEYQSFLSARKTHASSPAAIMAQMAAGGAFTSAGWAARLQVRTLVVHGTADALITTASSKALAQTLPHARYLEFYHVGHFPMLEHTAFYPAIERFLAGHTEGLAPERHETSLVKRIFNRYFTLHG
jgi:pimeloyl-ACP methyl ester carboxylesterase